jgi:hypothetical protein
MTVDTPTAAVAITNLLATYAECIDTGDLDGAQPVFSLTPRSRSGLVRAAGTLIDSVAMLDVWRKNVIIHPDGTPRTKHVITNANVDVDEIGGVATCRSYYTVFQQLEGFALQPIIAGRYHDKFEHVGDAWRWSFRDYTLVDLVGDLSQHLRMEVRLVTDALHRLFSLAGKTALVTGGGQGIGRMIAHGLVEAGATVYNRVAANSISVSRPHGELSE